MTNQRYERLETSDEEGLPINANELDNQSAIPNSPPPSFHSRSSSRRSSTNQSPAEAEVERSLDDAFGGPHDSDNEDDDEETRRLVSHVNALPRPGAGARQTTDLPYSTAGTASSGRVYGGGSGTRDGVFANLSAKPTVGGDLDEKPPSYEQAAADAAPPYWETTILAPAGYSSDDVFVDGLLVGSIFSFVWNALISMSFQLIGFLLTYLLHTSHAAKHGSRAGLGITLIQFGFTMRSMPAGDDLPLVPDDGKMGAVPADPNDHNFDPSKMTDPAGNTNSGAGLSTTSDWISYALMIAGWFLLIKASVDFVRARKQEQLIRNSPERGLPVPIIATGEGENAV